jgi:MarR family transcriptional regulator, organic hydroperoxide resistance regulator
LDKDTKANARRLDELMVPMMQMMHSFSTQMSRLEDFTMAQHRALMMVSQAGTMTVKQFQENLSIAQSTASETVERLVQLGWLKKGKNPKDRRITVFSLTEKAARRHKQKEAKRIIILEKLLEPLSEEEQRKFLDSFELLLKRHRERRPNPNGKGYHDKN